MPDIPRTFGDQLRAGRVAAGLTQREVAEAVGAHQSTVSTWELNTAVPDVRTVKALADALSIDFADLAEAAAEVERAEAAS